jgi:hypothetical protein
MRQKRTYFLNGIQDRDYAATKDMCMSDDFPTAVMKLRKKCVELGRQSGPTSHRQLNKITRRGYFRDSTNEDTAWETNDSYKYRKRTLPHEVWKRMSPDARQGYLDAVREIESGRIKPNYEQKQYGNRSINIKEDETTDHSTAKKTADGEEKETRKLNALQTNEEKKSKKYEIDKTAKDLYYQVWKPIRNANMCITTQLLDKPRINPPKKGEKTEDFILNNPDRDEECSEKNIKNMEYEKFESLMTMYVEEITKINENVLKLVKRFEKSHNELMQLKRMFHDIIQKPDKSDKSSIKMEVNVPEKKTDNVCNPSMEIKVMQKDKDHGSLPPRPKRRQRYAKVLREVLHKCLDKNTCVPNARIKGSCGAKDVMRDSPQSRMTEMTAETDAGYCSESNNARVNLE